jgi:hypothetical protein
MAVPLLAKHVHVCVADNNAVFLDLDQDRYIGLDVERTDILLRIMKGESAADAEVAALMSHLMDQRLLTQDTRSGRALRLTKIAEPVAGLIGFEYDPPCEVRWHHALALAAAYFEVTASLRFRSLAATIATAVGRQHAASKRRSGRPDVEHVRALVLAFRRLRPLFYRSRQRCLLDSLVLASFLAKYRVFPNVVIGVTLGPFAGHCWVQYETLVLNDRLEWVTKFTPILST